MKLLLLSIPVMGILVLGPMTGVSQDAPAPPKDLPTARLAFNARVLTALAPLDDLRTKFTEALGRLRQTAEQKKDVELVKGVDTALEELRKTGAVTPSKFPDLERLRGILDQQTALRSKEVIPALTAEAKKYRTDLEGLKARLGLANRTADIPLVDMEIKLTDLDTHTLANGAIPWWGEEAAGTRRTLRRYPIDEKSRAMLQGAVASATTPPANAAPAVTSPPADVTWPRKVALDDAPEVTVVTEDPETKQFVYRSAHYEFICDSKLGANVVREFGRIFEAAYLVNCKLPLDLKPKPEPLKEFFTATLYTNKADYHAAGGTEGSAGVYMRGKKTLAVPLSSLGVKMVGSRVSLDYQDEDNRTLIHEITHQMMNHWLRNLPTWLIEGSADFVAMSKYDNGRFNFGQMDRQLPTYLARRGRTTSGATLLGLSELMQIDGAAWSQAVVNRKGSINYATAALLTYYFYLLDDKKDGAHIIAFFRDIEKGVDKNTAIETHLLRGRTHADLEKEMIAAFKKEGAVISFISNGSPATTTSSSN